jgi:hypothetical protein
MIIAASFFLVREISQQGEVTGCMGAHLQFAIN